VPPRGFKVIDSHREKASCQQSGPPGAG
jgi:hypothetical protein